jgi:hypothetical protein
MSALDAPDARGPPRVILQSSSSRFQREADIKGQAGPAGSVANDRSPCKNPIDAMIP